MSLWRGRGKEPELLATIAGEASAEAAFVLEHAQQPMAPVDLTAAAFFDVDNTMMMGASIFHFARGMAARKFFTTADLTRFALQQVAFRVTRRPRVAQVAGAQLRSDSR